MPAGAEDALRSTALALRGLRIPRYACLFEAFANVVPFQQVSLDAGIAIVGRLVERFAGYVELAGRRYQAFPKAAAIADAPPDALRECGLSARKAKTLRELARVVESGVLSETSLDRMSTADALQALTALPGIGPWSAALVMLRGLGRADVFPPGDVGATRVLGELMKLPPQIDIERLAGKFGAVRGYLYFCALGSSLLAKGLIQPAPPCRRAQHDARWPPSGGTAETRGRRE
jgi:3-methyladenine DNA glycosylase/8-oxoguanine DNA glycosylase